MISEFSIFSPPDLGFFDFLLRIYIGFFMKILDFRVFSMLNYKNLNKVKLFPNQLFLQSASRPFIWLWSHQNIINISKVMVSDIRQIFGFSLQIQYKFLKETGWKILQSRFLINFNQLQNSRQQMNSDETYIKGKLQVKFVKFFF